MNREQNVTSNVCTISDNNLEAVLFSEFAGAENMIITSDGVSNLSELDGTLCYDETTNELVYVNMIQSNLSTSDPLSNASQSVFATLGEVSALTEASTFSDGSSVMLLANGSIVIPSNNDNDLSVSTHTDSLFLQFVPNPSSVPVREPSRCALTTIHNPADSSSNSGEYNGNNDAAVSVATLRENCKNTDVDDVLDNLKLNYRCESCSMTFSRNKDYQTHMLNHKDKVHKCSHCGHSFNKLKNLILHEALHNPIDTICPLSNCQKKFRRLASLKAHIKMHEEEETLTCTKCGEEFRSQICLELHYKCFPQCGPSIDIHDSSQCVQKSTSKLCKLCNRKFQDLSAFIAHKKEHEKIKKALATKSHRKKTSSTSKPSSRINRCKVCPKCFLKPSQLVRHMRIHTGERPYKCTECNKAFNQANSLKTHMLKHTGDRPYQCQFCHSGFSQRGNLRQHINRVHLIPKVEDPVYECSECSCRFKKICSLNAHRNRVHRKGYKLVLSPEEVENEIIYLSGSRESSRCTSPGESNSESVPVKESSATKTNNHMYMCSECAKTFKTIGALKNHLNEVHIQLPATQDELENSITLENDLDDLDEEEVENLLKKRTTVNTITIAVDRGGGELWNQKVFIKKKGNRQLYQCSHCPKESVKLNEMIRHTKINVMGKLFKCDYCQKTFSQHSTFKTHLLLHATAKTYDCEVCQQKFSNPAELNAHSKSHSLPNDDVICMICLKTYSSKEQEEHRCLSTATIFDVAVSNTQKVDDVAQSVRLNDVQQVHDEANLVLPPYICTYCNIMFKSYGKLKLHLQDHDQGVTTHYNPRFLNGEKPSERIDAAHCDKAGDIVEENLLKCDELTGFKERVRSRSKEINVTRACRDQDKSVSSSIRNVSSATTMMNAASNLNVNDVQNEISGFVVSENQTVNLNIHQTVDQLNENDQMAKFEVINVQDNANEFQKDDVSYTSTADANASNRDDVSCSTSTERVNNYFLDAEVTTLPVESMVTQTESMFNMPGDIIYKCTSCNEQYSAELDLQKHFQESESCNNGIPDITHHYFYACNTCYLTFKTLNSFLRHLQTHNGSGTYTCIYCDRPNRTEAELTQHIAAHALKKEYPCVHCGELAETSEAVKKHITDVHLMSSADSKALETKRKKTISSELLLTEKEKLMLVDHKPNKYSSISEKVLSSLLKKNVKKEGGNGRTEETSDESEILSKTKKKRANLNAKENKCNYCERSFKKTCDLIRHVRIHTGEKPFKCDYCNKCFTVKSILNCHLKTHFTVKNIFCHICNRFFSTVGSLKIHMRLHTGDRPYKCLYCKESFRTSGHRDSHQKRHVGEKDKTRTGAIEAAMAEFESQENLDVSLSEVMNLQDSNFLISKIADIDDFKFQENTCMDLMSVESFSNSNDCAICRESFKTKNDLDGHMSVHRAGGGELPCNVCDARFKELSSFEAHMKAHVPSLLINCDMCQETFASTKTLKIHKTRQHPNSLELPFQDDNESFLILDVNDKSNLAESSSAGVYIENTNNRNKSKWSEQKDLNLSVLVGKNKKVDALNDFFIMEKQFDLNSMISDFFPDD